MKTRSRINKTDVFYGDDGEKIEAVTEIQVHRPASLWVNEAKIAKIATKSSPIDGGCNGKTIYTWFFFHYHVQLNIFCGLHSASDGMVGAPGQSDLGLC